MSKGIEHYLSILVAFFPEKLIFVRENKSNCSQNFFFSLIECKCQNKCLSARVFHDDIQQILAVKRPNKVLKVLRSLSSSSMRIKTNIF